MADTTTAQMRIMLQGYEQQLLAARRLARFRVRRRLAEGLEPQDPDPSVKRRAYVEKVAQELFDSLIFTGSDNRGTGCAVHLPAGRQALHRGPRPRRTASLERRGAAPYAACPLAHHTPKG